MDALDLYIFCEDKEMDWRDNKLIIWIRLNQLKEFIDLLSPCHFDERGIEIFLKSDCIAFDLCTICEICGIDPERILKKC